MSATDPPRRARRRSSRAKPKPPRPRAQALSELRALGGLVLELALQDPAARPPASLVAWAARLAAELGCAPAEPPATRAALMRRLADVDRQARRGVASPAMGAGAA